MKQLFRISLLILVFTNIISAQKPIERYLDYNHKICEPERARFVGLIVKTDSGWLRVNYYLPSRKTEMRGLYKDSNCTVKNGWFYYFHANGKLEATGKFEENKKEGMWLEFHPNGFIKDSTVFDAGEKTGVSLQWYNNGYLKDSTHYNPDGTAVQVTWHDDGSVSSAGRLNNINLYTGKWQFFHKNGKLSADELYDNGKLLRRTYFSTFGVPESDTSIVENPATFPGGLNEWGKFLGKKLYWPADYRIVQGEKAEIGVDFMIDEEGNVKDININTPFEEAFNNIVYKTIAASPKWIPAMSHNRKVVYHHKQTVGFTQRRD